MFDTELASAAAPAIVSFAIAPSDEVYVDARQRRVNLSMRDVKLSPGQYEDKVRNTTLPARVQTIKADTGTHIDIRCHFLLADIRGGNACSARIVRAAC